MEDANRLGALGELLLQQWATEARVTVNKALNDTGGWDFFLEWPLSGPPSQPLDRHASPLQCLVQVKSTRARSRRKAISIKNWTKLCRTSLPAFYLILEFDNDACTRTFLVHVWEHHFERVLKRLRELSASGVRALHAETQTLTWSRDDELPEASSPTFAKAVAERVGDTDSYASRKRHILNTMGGNGGDQALVSIEVPAAYKGRAPQDLLDDLVLGILPELRTTGGAIWEAPPHPTLRHPDGHWDHVFLRGFAGVGAVGVVHVAGPYPIESTTVSGSMPFGTRSRISRSNVASRPPRRIARESRWASVT